MAGQSASDEFGSRDRREHGGSPAHHDDDALARRTERERVDAGIEDFDPNDVPPATDEEPVADADDEAYLEERAEVDRQAVEGELRPITEENPFPPTRYDRD
jgi:hypothetical protein